jgi:hypothetical protein
MSYSHSWKWALSSKNTSRPPHLELTKPENAPVSKAMPRVTPSAANCIPPCYEKVRSPMAGNIAFAALMSSQVLTA